jgi:mono/diheme cytochrome c family protein
MANMDEKARRALGMRKALFCALLGLIVVSMVLAVRRKGEWVIPEEAARRQNPVAGSAAAVKAGREVYEEHCERCHGVTGRGDGADAWKHFTSPGDLTDAGRMNALSDGAIFYQISEGRKPMPSFKMRLTEEQRWELVVLIRSFVGGGEK